VDVFAQLEEQFAGAAETAARNDPFQRIAVTVGELQEKIGVELLPQLNDFADYLAESEFQTAFTDLATAIGLVIDQIDIMSKQITGDSALTVLLNMATTVGYGIAELAFIVGDAANTLGKFFSGDWAGAANNVSTFITRYNKFIDQLKDEVLASRKIIETPLKPGGVAKSTITGIATGSSGAKEAQSQFDKVRKIIKDYQGKLLKAEQDYNKAKLEINQEYEDTVKKLREDAAQAQLDIVNESIDRLRNAFRSATQFGLGDLFGTQTINEVTTQVKKLTDRLTVTVAKETSRTIGGTVDDLISSLGEKLAASRSLVKNATDLAAKGFSQTFIEQVVETGTDTGNVLASAILNASPEQQAALKKNFLELETVSETGMDALAKKIYDSQGLATRELKALYTTVQKELDAALLAEQAALAKALADAGYAFTESIAGIKTEFEDVIDSLDGKFAGLGKTIDKLLAKMAQLQGKGITDVQAALISDGGPLKDNTITQDIKVAKNAFDAVGIVIDSAADIEGSMAYIQARIDAANRYIKNVGANTAQGASATASVGKFTQELANLQAAAATGNAAGTIVNINVKTDTTQSAAMVGNTIGKVITKYQSTGGTVRVSGQQ
jgi:flagellar biosynthesis chaperone FliJ